MIEALGLSSLQIASTNKNSKGRCQKDQQYIACEGEESDMSLPVGDGVGLKVAAATGATLGALLGGEPFSSCKSRLGTVASVSTLLVFLKFDLVMVVVVETACGLVFEDFMTQKKYLFRSVFGNCFIHDEKLR